MKTKKVSCLHEMRKLCGMLVLMLLAVFCLQNLGSSSIDFFIWSFEAPRALIYALVFVSGGLVGLLMRRRKGLVVQKPSEKSGKVLE